MAMTALDFTREGVRWQHWGGQVIPHGPVGRPDLLEALRAEVDRRFPLWLAGAPPRLPGLPRSGRCDYCGDELAPGRGGCCALCSIAAHKAAVATGRREAVCRWIGPPPPFDEVVLVPDAPVPCTQVAPQPPAPAPRRIRVPRLPRLPQVA